MDRVVRAARTGLARVHTWLYRVTRGRIGSRFGHLEQVLLTTTGRRTGRARTTPLAAVADGERLVLVASNWGQSRNPDWYLNLVADPAVVIQRGSRAVPMLATVASAQQRARLWPLVVAAFSVYQSYARRAHREIPLVICEAADGDGVGPGGSGGPGLAARDPDS